MKWEPLQNHRLDMGAEGRSPVRLNLEPPTGDPDAKAFPMLNLCLTEAAIGDGVGWGPSFDNAI
jgi:hypothetical protein